MKGAALELLRKSSIDPSAIQTEKARETFSSLM